MESLKVEYFEYYWNNLLYKELRMTTKVKPITDDTVVTVWLLND